MRCPKCHYLSFEPEPRCKNCGYDLAFESVDLAITPAESAQQSLADFDLQVPDAASHPPRPLSDSLDLLEDSSVDPAPRSQPAAAVAISEPPVAAKPAPGAPAPRPPAAPTTELPLFVQGMNPPARPRVDHDEPLVKVPRAPRAPLSVRRPTPAPGRVREKYHRAAPVQQAGLLEPDLLDVRPRDDRPVPSAPETPSPVAARLEEIPARPAGAFRRIEAACVDVLFIGAINVAVVWLTLQRCDLTFADASQLPMLPLFAYLFLVDGGYLLMFTVINGQTVGKMAAGLRVVGAPSDAFPGHVTLKQAALRAVLTFPSVLALGLGFMPALLGRGPTLHDRFAHTRVVRA